MIRIVTTGSIWLLTDEQYCRFPKEEGPRRDENGNPRPEWGAGPGPLQDAVWHPYKSWEYTKNFGSVCLRIVYPDNTCQNGEKCTDRHWLITGPVLEPYVDPDTVTRDERDELEKKIEEIENERRKNNQ